MFTSIDSYPTFTDPLTHSTHFPKYKYTENPWFCLISVPVYVYIPKLGSGALYKKEPHKNIKLSKGDVG